jgi:hypothetical protein
MQESIALQWFEIASGRGKMVHPEARSSNTFGTLPERHMDSGCAHDLGAAGEGELMDKCL